ncbi:MAG: APC family permease [Lachnospiraceae bacterium]|nr:APC family permease [Lachnospiraceae bacterium]
MSEQNNVIRTEAPAPGTLKKSDLYAISLGYVIGAGIVTLVGPAIALTGMSAWLAYFVAIIFGFIINLPAVFVTSSLRMAGGPYSMLAGLGGKRLAGMYALTFLTTVINMGGFGIAIGWYVNTLWPFIPAKAAGIAAITFFYLVNLMGVDIMAKVQKAMTWILLAAFGLFIVKGFTGLNNPVFDFSNPEFMPNGIQGFISAVFLYVVSTNGYLMTMSYGKVAKKATRDIPWAMLMCVPTFIVVYCGVTIVGAGVLPIEQMAGKPLTVVANVIWNPFMFVLFMVGGPFMALTSTMNSAYGNNCFPVAQSAKDGWLPKWVAKQNGRGAYYVILTIIWVIGLIPLLTGFDINSITRTLSIFFAGLSFLYTFAYWQLPKKYPEAWKKSKLHVPDGVYYASVIVGFIGWAAVFVYSLKCLPVSVAVITVLVYVGCVSYGVIRSKDERIKVETSMWEDTEE